MTSLIISLIFCIAMWQYAGTMVNDRAHIDLSLQCTKCTPEDKLQQPQWLDYISVILQTRLFAPNLADLFQTLSLPPSCLKRNEFISYHTQHKIRSPCHAVHITIRPYVEMPMTRVWEIEVHRSYNINFTIEDAYIPTTDIVCKSDVLQMNQEITCGRIYMGIYIFHNNIRLTITLDALIHTSYLDASYQICETGKCAFMSSSSDRQIHPIGRVL